MPNIPPIPPRPAVPAQARGAPLPVRPTAPFRVQLHAPGIDLGPAAMGERSPTASLPGHVAGKRSHAEPRDEGGASVRMTVDPLDPMARALYSRELAIDGGSLVGSRPVPTDT